MPINVPIAKRKAIGERTAENSKRKRKVIKTLAEKFYKGKMNLMINKKA